MAEDNSALAMLGIIPWPIGTRDEVADAGYDPTLVASCCKDKKGEVRGCPAEGSCRFHHPKLGGFKFKGPRYVGWSTITDEGTANSQFGPCHVYVNVIQGRADHGAELRRKGMKGDMIRITAQEGETIETRLILPHNMRGEIINQSPELMDVLEAQGKKVKRSEVMVESVSWKPVVFKIEVPKFPRPGDRSDLSFVQRMVMAEQDHMALEDEVELEVLARERERIDSKEEDEPQTVAAIAEPVRRGPGRPRKVEE